MGTVCTVCYEKGQGFLLQSRDIIMTKVIAC